MMIDNRTIEILRRALAWHGNPVRMAKTREDWQQTVDEAIVWVKENPEPGYASFPTDWFAFTEDADGTPLPTDLTVEDYSYDELWGAIAAATRIDGGIVAISVVKFREAIRAIDRPVAEADAQPHEGIAWRLDRIRDDGGPLTASDKGVLREASDLLRSTRPPAQAGAASVEAIEKAARYVLDNSRRGNASLNSEQFAADTQKLMTAYRDIIGKALASGHLSTSAASGEIPGGTVRVSIEHIRYCITEIVSARPGRAKDALEKMLGSQAASRDDDAARALYDTWSDRTGWVPWVERGNSTMQDQARREASKSWRWWAGREKGEYSLSGPCETQDAAINVAYGDTVPGDTIHLVEAIAENEADEDGVYAFIAERNHAAITHRPSADAIADLLKRLRDWAPGFTAVRKDCLEAAEVIAALSTPKASAETGEVVDASKRPGAGRPCLYYSDKCLRCERVYQPCKGRAALSAAPSAPATE